MRRVLLVCVLLLCACARQAALPTAAPPPPDPKALMPALESRIYELVDTERRKLDPAKEPLALDSELIAVAREKSLDMAIRNYAAHASPDGETSATIIMAKDAGFHGLLGENIAVQPYLPEYGVDVDTFARRIVDTWLASKAHRENLADPAYARTGVGAAVNANSVYVTELFSGQPDSAAPAPSRK
jgi:uncharacterized protein YkwD